MVTPSLLPRFLSLKANGMIEVQYESGEEITCVLLRGTTNAHFRAHPLLDAVKD
jgi:hypothetical protein